jgi:ElaB/YqjD/DUF883 family membrane-anchored ribosome-binding protein
MPDEKNELPEGTDKVIVGASSATTGGPEAIEPNEETDVIVIDIDGRGPAAGATTGLSPGGLSAGGLSSDTSPSADTPTSSSAAGNPAGRGAVINKLRSGGEKLSGQAADKARGLVGQGLERGSEALANVGRMVGDTAEGIDERLGAEYGDYARRAASAIEDAANSLASKDADELIEDTRTFVRKSPGVALAGAAVVGFALARLIKAGLDRGSDDDGPSGRRPGGSSEA